MGFYTAIDEQTIQPGQSVIFTLTQIRDNTVYTERHNKDNKYVSYWDLRKARMSRSHHCALHFQYCHGSGSA